MDSRQDLQQRLAFVGLSSEAQARLRGLRSIVDRAIGPALDIFYNKVRTTSQISGLFPTPAVIEHAKAKQADHWRIIADAQFGPDYASNVLKIGQTHARLGLEPRWYIGGYALMLEQLIHAVLAGRRPGVLAWKATGQIRAADDLSVLVKAALLDMDLAISTYLDALEEKRQMEEARRLKAQAEQAAALEALSRALGRLAAGDLTTDFNHTISADFDKLKKDVNDTIAQLATAMTGVAEVAAAIHAGAGEITAATDDMGVRIE